MRLYSDAELAQILDKDIFRKISDAADSLGVECYVVGGFVRDIFLGRPSNDIDVVVVGSGIAVATELKKRLGRRAHLSVFRNFGTAQVKFFSLSDERVALSDERVALSDEDVAMSEKQEKQSSLNPQPSARLQQETLSKRSGERTLNHTTLPDYPASPHHEPLSHVANHQHLQQRESYLDFRCPSSCAVRSWQRTTPVSL